MTSEKVSRRAMLMGATVLLSLPEKALAGDDKDPAAQFVCTDRDCDPFIYDPAIGDPDNVNGDHPVPPGTAFSDLPDDWICPICGTPKADFVRWHPV